MLKSLRKLFALLSSKQRANFYRIQILVVVMAFMELIGVASVVPFMALVGNPGLIEKNVYLSYVYKLSALREDEFIFLIGVSALIALALSTIVSMYTTWRSAMFGAKLGTEIADSLYQYYLRQSWMFHVSTSSASLTKKVSTESIRLTDQVIQPLMHMNAKITLVIVMSATMFLLDPIAACVGLSIIAIVYLFIFLGVRGRLLRNGQKISMVQSERFRLMNEGFGGVKDILILQRAQFFIGQFHTTGDKLADAKGLNIALGHLPRYLMELMAYGAMVGLVLFLIKTHQGNLGYILPVLSVYALAGFKLLPAAQQIYNGLTQIRGNIAAFEAIQHDFEDMKRSEERHYCRSLTSKTHDISIGTSIDLEGVTFTYPSKKKVALNNTTMKFPVNKTIGIVGSSGSGKTTIVDILLGLITPQTGKFNVDSVEIKENNIESWQRKLGYVSQNIFLSEGSIAENIAFGIAKNDIELDKISMALSLSCSHEFVASLTDGIHTKIGERGIQLSGGQRQRIGIARALYQQAEVLIFDEATSALDGKTEKAIMEAVNQLSGKKTIIMVAHRLKTVQQCDIIYYLDAGRVIDKGTFEELLNKNSSFREMAAHA